MTIPGLMDVNKEVAMKEYGWFGAAGVACCSTPFVRIVEGISPW